MRAFFPSLRQLPRSIRLLARALCGVGALIGAPAFAQPAPSPCSLPAPPSHEEIQAAAEKPVDRGFLWRVDKGGHTSWLYGTMHVGKPGWFYPGKQVRGALRQSDTVALELDMADPATAQAFVEVSDAAVMARMSTPQRQRRIDRQVQEACLPAGSLAPMRPTLQVMALAGLTARRDGLYEQWGSEGFLTAYAKSNGKKLVALETARGQLRALLGNDEAEELSQFDEALDQLESGEARAQGRELATVWADSDWRKLSAYRQWCDCVKTPADERALRRLLDDRNPGMADGIAKLHAAGQRVFAAVGALHMVGSHGLPVLLAARGFTVARVLPAP